MENDSDSLYRLIRGFVIMIIFPNLGPLGAKGLTVSKTMQIRGSVILIIFPKPNSAKSYQKASSTNKAYCTWLVKIA